MADSHQMFINGEWVNSSDGGTRDIISPHTGEVIGSVQEGTAEDVDKAVAAAKKAFDDTWFDTTPKSTPTRSSTSSPRTPASRRL